jgi:hypothetical protein
MGKGDDLRDVAAPQATQTRMLSANLMNIAGLVNSARRRLRRSLI